MAQSSANVEQKDESKQSDPITESKVNIVLTGSTGVIGGAIAQGIVSRPNVSLHLLVRNENKAKDLIDKSLAKSMHKTSSVTVHKVDLSSKASMDSFIESFINEHSFLDVLINNAAIVPNKHMTSEDGHELQFAVNVMSYHRLMNGLIPLLAASGGNAERRKMVPFARIVNVASQYTTSLTNDPGKNFNLKKAPKRYDSNVHYKKSKAANRMLSFKASLLYQQSGYNVAVYSCHPGVTSSNVLQGLGFGAGYDSAKQCAKTPLFLAFDPKCTMKQSGKFFVNSRPQICGYCKDQKKVQMIWDYCSSLL